MIKEMTDSLTTFWDAEVTTYELNNNNTIVSRTQTLLMTLHKSIMASLTTMTNDPGKLSFHYCQEEISSPLPNIVSTFYRAIYNSYYVVFPYLYSSTSAELDREASSKISTF